MEKVNCQYIIMFKNNSAYFLVKLYSSSAAIVAFGLHDCHWD